MPITPTYDYDCKTSLILAIVLSLKCVIKYIKPYSEYIFDKQNLTGFFLKTSQKTTSMNIFVILDTRTPKAVLIELDDC